jgi:hypothetical protein
MSNAVFPVFPGLTWTVKRTPAFRKLLQTAANGYSVRVLMQSDPMWIFECSFSFLRDDVPNDELNQMLGFFLARQGGFDSFLLDLGALTKNPADSAVEDQPLTIDANNCAPLVRTLGSSDVKEAIYELNGTPAINLNGSPLAAGTDYTLYTPAQTAAGTLNANNVTYSGYAVKFLHSITGALTADFGFYYRVIFSSGKGMSQDPQIGDDQQDFELLWFAGSSGLSAFYEAQQITLVTARE